MTDPLNLLEQMLEKEARQFEGQHTERAEPATKSIIVLDLEYLWHRDAYAGYAISEGVTACKDIRWPFHKIAAACWLSATFTVLLERLFDALHENGTAVLATWGGEVRDLAVLRHRAEVHDLILPQQLRNGSPHAPQRLDLCRATCVQAAAVHLGEYAASSSIPAKPLPAKQIGALAERGEWGKVREQVCADVLTTSVIALRYLSARDLIRCDRASSQAAIAEAAASSIPHSKFVSRDFVPWAMGQPAALVMRDRLEQPFH
jgi:hypothetical protein